jgi:hypothetical protein
VPITLNCPCGKMLRVPDDSAGKRAKCPACSAVVAIPLPPPPPAPPEPEPVFEIEEPPAPAPGLPHTYKPALDDDDDATPYGLAAPEKPDPVTGEEARPKRLPNFRRGNENYS